jgi:uncharacterized lipoprotein
MLKCIKSLLLASSLTVTILLTTGCALSPQIINLHTNSPLETNSTQVGRSALVRVRDLRDETEQLGSRGGSQPESAPLLSKPNLQKALQVKMQNSLQQLGFGGDGSVDALKVDLAIEQFDYQCNEGMWVNKCELSMTMRLSIDNEALKFSQPFNLNETRSVIAAPRSGYNQTWINQSIDKFWQYMMNQEKVKVSLGI